MSTEWRAHVNSHGYIQFDCGRVLPEEAVPLSPAPWFHTWAIKEREAGGGSLLLGPSDQGFATAMAALLEAKECQREVADASKRLAKAASQKM